MHTVADDDATALDVTPWLEQKVGAILAHRTEVQRGALPGLVADPSQEERRCLLATEWYVRVDSGDLTLSSPGRPRGRRTAP